MKDLLKKEQEEFEKEDFELGTTMDGDNISINYPKLKSWLSAHDKRILEVAGGILEREMDVIGKTLNEVGLTKIAESINKRKLEVKSSLQVGERI